MDAKVAELRDLGISGEHYTDGNCLRRLEAEIAGLLHEEEQYLKQRARVLWLEEGDKNTCFFFPYYASALQYKNRIVSLLDNEDIWVTLDDGITRIVGEFFF